MACVAGGKAEADPLTQINSLIGNVNALPVTNMILDNQDHFPVRTETRPGLGIHPLHCLPIGRLAEMTELSRMIAVEEGHRASAAACRAIRKLVPAVGVRHALLLSEFVDLVRYVVP